MMAWDNSWSNATDVNVAAPKIKANLDYLKAIIDAGGGTAEELVNLYWVDDGGGNLLLVEGTAGAERLLPLPLTAPTVMERGKLVAVNSTGTALEYVDGVPSGSDGITVSASPPENPTDGMPWIDTDDTSVTPPTWTAPTLLNSWANYGGEMRTAGYYKDANNLVRLRGVLVGGSTGSVIFVLPSGYRPAGREYFTCMGAGAFAAVTIMTDGSVRLDSGSPTLSICGICFEGDGS